MSVGVGTEVPKEYIPMMEEELNFDTLSVRDHFIDNIKKQIRRLVKATNFFPGCDSCVGRPYDATSSLGYDGKGMIPAGEQVSKPIPYRLYK